MGDLDDLFDKNIGETLRNFEVPYQEGSWEMLKDKMTTEAGGDELDTLARNALGNLAVPVIPANWDVLKQKMGSVKADAMDDLAKKALEHYAVPYDFSTWTLLKSQLDRLNFNRKVVAVKSMEAALILFAILTLVRIIGQFPKNDVPKASESTMAQIVTSQSATQLQNADPEAADQISRDAMAKNLTEASVENLEEAVSPETFGRQPHVNSETKTNASSNVLSNTLHIERLYARQELPLLQHAANNKVLVADQRVRGLAKSNLVEDQILDDRYIQRITDVSTVPTLSLQTLASTTGFLVNDLSPISVQRKSRISTALSVYVPFNSHSIENRHARLPGRRETQKQGSKGIGMGTIVRFGRFGFDLGLAYDHLAYRAEASESEIKKLEIPIHLRYALLSTDNVELYMKGGMVYHGVMTANYAPLSFTSRGGGSSDSDGLLNGGYREFNTYRQLSAGVGLEIRLHKHWSMFAEGLYQDHYKGSIGNTDAKFTTISSKVGLNYTF